MSTTRQEAPIQVGERVFCVAWSELGVRGEVVEGGTEREAMVATDAGTLACVDRRGLVREAEHTLRLVHEAQRLLLVSEEQRASIEKALQFLAKNGALWSAVDASALDLVRAAGQR